VRHHGSVIETERLLLRKPRLEDAPALLALYTDPVAMRFIGGVRSELTDTDFVVRRWLERWELNGGFGQLVAERREDGVVLGRVGLVVWDTSVWTITSTREAGTHAQPELGWALARGYWGYAEKLGCVPGDTIALADTGPAVVWEHPHPARRGE
jgi:RimJ/RimL family protein N-acetyltransferase